MLPCRAEGEGLRDRLGLAGTARISYFSRDASFVHKVGSQNDSLWITSRPPSLAGLQAYFDGRVQAQLVQGGSEVEGDVREGYIEKAIGDLDIKVGRQIVVWGRADKINPTDVWSVKNYQLLVTDDDDQRTGLSTVQTGWHRDRVRISAIWQPEFRGPKLPLPPTTYGRSLSTVVAGRRAEQVGGKFDYSGAGVDWSVSYAHVLERTPELVLATAPGATVGPTARTFEMRPELRYGFADTIGADAAAVVGNYGMRVEAAFTRPADKGRTAPLTPNDTFFLVAGADRTFGGVLNINTQYLFKRAMNFVETGTVGDPTFRLVVAQAHLIRNQTAATMQGASLRVNFKTFHETLEMEVAGAVWFEKCDAITSVKISYAFDDRFKGVVGGYVYSGPRDSFFGRLHDTSSAFMELRIAL